MYDPSMEQVAAEEEWEASAAVPADMPAGWQMGRQRCGVVGSGEVANDAAAAADAEAVTLVGLWKDGVVRHDAWSKLPPDGHSARPCIPTGLTASGRPQGTANAGGGGHDSGEIAPGAKSGLSDGAKIIWKLQGQ